MYKIRMDMLICMILAGLLTFGVTKLLPGIYTIIGENYDRMHTVADGEIGGKAGKEVYRAQNVEDLLSHDTFTIEMKDTKYMVAKTAYFGKIYLHILELPSGELVAANIGISGEQEVDETFIAPVGKLVKADLSKNERFMSWMSRHGVSEELLRTDFYLDMKGKGCEHWFRVERFDDTYTIFIQSFVALFSFFAFHIAGCKVGIFPPFIPKRKNRKS